MSPTDTFTCRVDPSCQRAYGTKQGRALHELVHRVRTRRPCPICHKPVAEQFMPRHQRAHKKKGRRVVAKERQRREPAGPRPLTAIFDELRAAVIRIEEENRILRKRALERDSALQTAAEAIAAAAAVRRPQVPRT